MATETLIILLFLVASLVSVVTDKLHVPYTVGLVLVGLGIGTLQLIHVPALTQDIMFLIFLPGLVFEAAYHIVFEDLWRDRIAVLGLVVPGVMLSIGVTAALLVFASAEIHKLPAIGWGLALVFGAAVAATDPISVVAIFRKLNAPRRLTLLIEGESLLNDGTAIVFFVLVLGLLVGETSSTSGVMIEFGRVVGGGILIGATVGLLISQLIRNIDNGMVEITLTTIAAYGSFLAAYQLGFSGVISTVTAGLICGNYGAQQGMSPSTRVAVETFWGYIGFALNSVVFLLMGLEVKISTLLNTWPVIVIAYIAMTAARGLVVFSTFSLLAFSRARIPWKWSAILIWGGLRGGLSMVLILSLPADLPLRELIINMVFGVILLSILVQGLSMTALTRRLGIVDGREKLAAYEVARVQRQLADDAIVELEQLKNKHYIDPKALDTLEAIYRERLNTTSTELDKLSLNEKNRFVEDVSQLQRRLLLTEKKTVMDAHKRGLIGPEAFTRLLTDIDARYLQLEANGLLTAREEDPGKIKRDS